MSSLRDLWGPPGQIGYIVNDLESAAQKWTDTIGIGRERTDAFDHGFKELDVLWCSFGWWDGEDDRVAFRVAPRDVATRAWHFVFDTCKEERSDYIYPL